MQNSDRNIELVILRAPWDIALPYVAGCLRALQGPLRVTPDVTVRPEISALDLLPLMMGALPSVTEAAMEIPSLDPTLVISPAGAGHLTVLETPPGLALGRVISAVAPRLTVIGVISRMPWPNSQRHELTVWQGGFAIRRVVSTLGAFPEDRFVAEGTPLPWERIGEIGGHPVDVFNREHLSASLAGLGLDLAGFPGSRSFARSALFSPLLTVQPGAEAEVFPDYGRITELALSLGHGQEIAVEDLQGDRRAESGYRQQLHGILSDFEKRIANIDSLDAIAAATVTVSDDLRKLGRRAEPALMHAAETAFARALSMNADHPATGLLRRMFEEAYRTAFDG